MESGKLPGTPVTGGLAEIETLIEYLEFVCLMSIKGKHAIILIGSVDELVFT